ncbi:hypothetical protein ANCCEY_05547 [Ancylostoma ceylanicum]|uniref:Uncharacterized protein n=1 Tax=Ancylostoma ceylanicum TaxID=53326 RepID=A0A0D6LVY5_9BILA|nr:hypothetical protein ANCCEY_05547 [Ancylostoma ceylanicum]
MNLPAYVQARKTVQRSDKRRPWKETDTDKAFAQESFGIWPILEGDDKWRVENFDLTSLLIHVSKIRRVHVFVKHTISLDSRNVSRCLIQFDRGSLKLAADSYLDKETFGETAYRQFLTDLVTLVYHD